MNYIKSLRNCYISLCVVLIPSGIIKAVYGITKNSHTNTVFTVLTLRKCSEDPQGFSWDLSTRNSFVRPKLASQTLLHMVSFLAWSAEAALRFKVYSLTVFQVCKLTVYLPHHVMLVVSLMFFMFLYVTSNHWKKGKVEIKTK